MMKEKALIFLEKHCGILLVLISLLIGLFTYDDYGLSWDEPQQLRTAQINFDYIFSADTSLLSWVDRDYGPAFGLTCILLKNVLGLTEIRDVYLFNHLITHLFFLLSCYFFFLLIDYLYKNKLLASLGFLVLLLHPRIYGHSFFNVKDIPFLSMFIIALYYSVKAFDKKSIWSFIRVGLCVGLLINIRILGIMVPMLISALLLLDFLSGEKAGFVLKRFSAFFVTACLSLYATWPFLWTKPIEHFQFALQNMSKFRWEGTVLFNGELIRSTELDWTYIPTWFTISTPIVFQVIGALGIILLIREAFKTPFKDLLANAQLRTNLMFLLYFIAPVLAVIALRSVLYDGWRHLFFIYPPFVLLMIFGLSRIKLRRRFLFVPVIAILVISLTVTATSIIRSFPLQHVYFNPYFSLKPAEYLRKNFELDYWGLSYRPALENILAKDKSNSIPVAVANQPGLLNRLMLRPDERDRIVIAPKYRASYFVTQYRWHPEDYQEYKHLNYNSIRVQNNTVNTTFELK